MNSAPGADHRILADREQYTSTTTVYAACATNNMADGFVGQPAGQGVANIIPPGGGAYPVYESSKTNSAYDCCVYGLLGPNSGMTFAYTPSDSSCVIGAYDRQCPATGQATSQNTLVQGSYTFVTGNLPCGGISAAS